MAKQVQSRVRVVAEAVEPRQLLSAAITGAIFHDVDGDGVRGTFEQVSAVHSAYLDLDANGLLDVGEPTASSSSNGFRFDPVDVGTYIVRVVPSTLAANQLVTTLGQQVTVTVVDGATATADLSYAAFGRILGDLYRDEDPLLPGIRGVEDLPIGNRKVFLDLNANGHPDAGEPQTMSDPSTGGFAFDRLAPGRYLVTQELPSGWYETTRRGTSIVIEGHDYALSLGSRPLALGRGGVRVALFDDRNADGVRGLYDSTVPTSLLGQAYLDINDNGAYDTGVDKLPRVQIPIADNAFVFADIVPGSYSIRWRDGNDYQQTTPRSVTIVADAMSSATDLGVTKRKLTISGLVYVGHEVDGKPKRIEWLLNARVYLDLNANGSFDTAEPSNGGTLVDGRWEIKDVPIGQYKLAIEPIPGDYYRLRWRTGTFATVSTFTQDGVVNLPADIAMQSSQVVPSFDFVFHPTEVIRGQIYRDMDRDGVQDTNEYAALPDIAGSAHAVYIDANDNGQLDTGERTAAADPIDGKYLFRNVSAGEHIVRMINMAYWDVTSPVDGRAVVSVPQWGNVVQDFGRTKGEVEGYVEFRAFVDQNADGSSVGDEWTQAWTRIDVNRNGIADFGEPQGTQFWLMPGTYRINYGPYVNGELTSTPHSLDITVTTGQSQRIEFGRYMYASLRGAVFVDSDGNGLRGGSEPVDTGRTAFIDTNANGQLDTGEASSVTDQYGQYYFNFLKPGTYRVALLPKAGFITSTPSSGYRILTVTSGMEVTDAHFATVPVPTAVTIQSESATLSGGTVKSTSHARFTGTGYADYAGQNSAVTYSLTRSSAGSSKLEFRYANGSTANRPLQVFVNNVSVGTLNFAKTGGWTTWATTSLTTNLPAGNVTIKVVASTSAGGANVDSLTISPVNVTPPPPPPPPPATTGSIGGYLFWDSNKNGKFDTGDSYQSGKVVFIDLDGDNTLDSNEKKLTTDSQGKFNFTGLAAGTYKIRRVVPSGYKVTTPAANFTITAGQIFSTVAIGTINA